MLAQFCTNGGGSSRESRRKTEARRVSIRLGGGGRSWVVPSLRRRVGGKQAQRRAPSASAECPADLSTDLTSWPYHPVLSRSSAHPRHQADVRPGDGRVG
jgi:hypothetical protein